MDNVYLDNAASTPIRPEVLEAMLPFLKEAHANPSSIHPMGQASRLAIEEARKKVAALIGAEPSEIVFTSGASEANNLALRGTSWTHAVTTALEHPSVSKTFQAIGRPVTAVKSGADGVVKAEDVMAAVRPETGLVSVMLVSNEIGTVQPVSDIRSLLDSRRSLPRATTRGGNDIIFHTDAVQAPVTMDIDVKKLGVDLMTLSAHKMGGPKGVGALYVRKGTKLSPQLTGGSHEMRMRAGTENVAGIVGFGAAAELLMSSKAAERARLMSLKEKLLSALGASGIAKPLLEGGGQAAHIVSIEVPGAEADFLVMLLGREGVMVTSGSACSSGSRDASPALVAMGVPEKRATSVIRASFGWASTDRDVDRFTESLIKILPKARA
jgi:cysteine desulfurase